MAINKKVRESKVEADIRDYAEATGWWVVKIEKTSKRGVMDRVLIKDGVTLWAEIKRPGEPPREQQVKRAKDMREHGAICLVWDNLEQAKNDLEYYSI